MHRRWWLFLVLLGLAVAGAWYFRVQAVDENRELPVYVRGGERMAAGEEIYRREQDAKPFTYPPFAAVPFVPFARLPADWQPPAWFLVNFAILLAMLRWLQRWADGALGAPSPAGRAAFWGLTLVLGAHHVTSVFSNQSHDLLVFGAVVLAAAAWCRSGGLAGGFAGVGAAMKATPLLFLVLFVLRRRLVAAVLLLASVALLSLLPDWLWPRGDGRSWVLAWYEVNLRGLQVGGTADARGAWNPHSVLNQGLSGTLTRLLTAVQHPGSFVVDGVALCDLSPRTFRGVSLALQVAVVVVLAWGIRRAAAVVGGAADRRAAQRVIGLGEVGMVACGMVLLSPQSSKAHFCVWLLPAAFLAVAVLRARRDLLLWLLLLAAFACGTLTAKGVVGSKTGNWLLALGCTTWSTLLLLLACVRAMRPCLLPQATGKEAS